DVGKGNSDRRHVCADAWSLDKGSPVIEESRRVSIVLSARDLPIEAVHQRVGTISDQSAFGNLRGVQLISHHGFDGIAPEGNHPTDLELCCACHQLPPW